MVKGVNKQIIEITNPDSEYFERALLFLKAGQSLPVREEAKTHAGEYILSIEDDGTRRPPVVKDTAAFRSIRRLSLAVKILSAFLTLSAVAILVLLIVFTKM